MSKVLVIQGAGMNMRGKSQIEIFGSTTLEEIDEQIMGYAEGSVSTWSCSTPTSRARW